MEIKLTRAASWLVSCARVVTKPVPPSCTTLARPSEVSLTLDGFALISFSSLIASRDSGLSSCAAKAIHIQNKR